MLKKIRIFLLITMISFLGNNVLADYEKLAYDFKFTDLDGTTLNLSEYKNKIIVVVNVASQCGFTKQYEDMQKVWENYQEKDVIIIGVPSNDFGNQEPGTNDEIKNNVMDSKTFRHDFDGLKITRSKFPKSLSTSLNNLWTKSGFETSN